MLLLKTFEFSNFPRLANNQDLNGLYSVFAGPRMIVLGHGETLTGIASSRPENVRVLWWRIASIHEGEFEFAVACIAATNQSIRRMSPMCNSDAISRLASAAWFMQAASNLLWRFAPRDALGEIDRTDWRAMQEKTAGRQKECFGRFL
jgi:hypothetical protein